MDFVWYFAVSLGAINLIQYLHSFRVSENGLCAPRSAPVQPIILNIG